MNPNKDFKNILIVRTDRLGDVVLTTPVFKALRARFPSARISLLVSAPAYDLVAKNPYLDEIIIDDRKNKHKGFFGFCRLLRRIASRRYDLAVVYHTKKRTNALCFLAGIPYRLGYRNNKFGFLLNCPVRDTRHEGRKHEAQYCMELLSSLGVSFEDYDCHVTLMPEAEKWLFHYLQTHNISSRDCLIAVHPGASDPSKMWPPKRFAELINRLDRIYDAKFFLVGAANLKNIAHEIKKEVTVPFFYDLVSLTSVSQLASLLAQCRLLVSNDSGPVHIAAALKTPVVSIFTRNQPGINPERWRPLNPASKVVTILPEKQGKLFRKSHADIPEINEKIGVDLVLEAVDAICKL